MASTDFVAAAVVEAAPGVEEPAAAPMVEAAPGVEEPAAAAVAEAPVGIEESAAAVGVEAAAVVEEPGAAASLRKLVEDIGANVEYAAWGTDAIQSSYDKLNVIERRSMTQNMELRESLRQIKNAVDVYKHEVADVAWLSL